MKGIPFTHNEATGALDVDSFALGWNINEACRNAVELAIREGAPVHFTFNETKVIATASDSPTALADKYMADVEAAHQAYINSDEYKERQRREKEELERKMAEPMRESAQTEAEMREAKDPWPYTLAHLSEYIESLVKRNHDYGTCVYAMSLAAVAAFNYVTKELGTTGFQASCADLDILRRTRHINGPFIVLTGEDALFPQYDLPAKLSKAMKEWKPWLKEQAAKNLASAGETTHPDVIRHWKKLAEVAHA